MLKIERERFFRILKEMHKVCEEVNKQIEESEPDNPLRYEVLQFSELARRWDSVYKISDFYNDNWVGNKDFMHIPNFEQVLSNCKKYPIIIAREKTEGEEQHRDRSLDILGISAIKYDENSPDLVDPYFPEDDAKYFSITGILVKKDTNHRGMGKKIYEIAIRGAYEYNKYYPGTRIMCVIDCRNNHSLRALGTAVENINQSGLVGKKKELPANIIGYYELRNPRTDSLEEAPTLVLEVGLEGREIKQEKSEERILEYSSRQGEYLFNSIRDDLKAKFKEHGLQKPIVNSDEGCGTVYYYPLHEGFRLKGTSIISNGTEKGNDREPIYDKYMHEFIGPIPSIAVEEER